jgi:hypothetical protein
MGWHQVTITMDAASTRALSDSGYALYAFSAVGCADAAALPLVWMRTMDYSAFTYLEWSDGLQAYTSTTPGAAGQRVKVGFAAPVEAGQQLTVTHVAGTGEVGPGPDPNGVWVANATASPFTCGLSREHEGGVAPVVAVPLYGGGADSISPRSTVLVMFSTASLAPGTAVEVSTGPGLLLDVSVPERTVSFGIDTGWRADGTPAGVAVPPLTPLAPLLVQAPPLDPR